jgi:GT2 family glycosyltransferase
MTHVDGSAKVNAVVLVPAYNASSTIADTLVALQTNLELDRVRAVVVLDDGSRDGTADVAKSAWQSRIPLEVWSNGINLGECTTMNSGFARLPKDLEWALILHADDVVNGNWLSVYFTAMASCPQDVATICSSYDYWDPDTGYIVPGDEHPERPNVLISGTREAVQSTLDRGCWWHVSGCAIRTKAFGQIGGLDTNLPYHGDWEWLLRCLAEGHSVLYLPRSTMLYRKHGHSVSASSFRRASDMRARIHVFEAYRDKGYLSPADYRRKIRSVIYQLSRRTLVRVLRGDVMGVRDHARLLAGTVAKYTLGPI